MAIKASASITLSVVVDVKATYRYYLLQSSTLSKPSKPTAYPPPSSWGDTEPTYTNGSTSSLYFVDCTVFCDDTFAYSAVSLSSSYEAAKAAYNKANAAQNSVNDLTTRVTNAETSITNNTKQIELRATKTEVTEAVNSIEIGGRNLLGNSNKKIQNSDYVMHEYMFGKSPPIHGETYTLTIKGELGSDRTNFVAGNSGGNVMFGTLKNNGDGTHSLTKAWNATGVSNTFLRIYQFTSSGTSTSTIEWIKLEKGNKATDWTPAPEDLENIGINVVPYAAFNSIRNVETTQSFLLSCPYGGSWITHENIVSILEPSTTYICHYELELLQKSTLPMFDKSIVGFLLYNSVDGSTINLNGQMPEDAHIGTTIAVERIFTTPSEWGGESLVGYSRRWKSADGTIVEYDTFRVTNFKIEKGTKPTDWTASPKDVDAKFNNYYTKTETDSKFTVESDRIISTVNTTTITNINTAIENMSVGGRNLILQSDFSGITPIEPYYVVDNAEHTLTITSTGVHPSYSRTMYISDYAIDNLRNKQIVLSGEYRVLTELEYGTTNPWIGYELSVRRDDTTGGGSQYFAWCGNTTIPSEVSDTWTKFVSIPKWPVSDFDILDTSAITVLFRDVIGSIQFRNFKIEIGNKATDWTPAPEDTAEDINNLNNNVDDLQQTTTDVSTRILTAESIIEQLSTQISMLVTDGNGTSLMTQTANGWTFNVASMQEALNNASSSLNDLANDIKDTNTTVSLLQQAADEFGTLSEYVKIVTYEGEPCIELGEGDSDFKLLITNTRIMFKEGSATPTYISNRTLITENIEVKKDLRQGGFVWMTHGNGNLGLLWKGVTE